MATHGCVHFFRILRSCDHVVLTALTHCSATRYRLEFLVKLVHSFLVPGIGVGQQSVQRGPSVSVVVRSLVRGSGRCSTPFLSSVHWPAVWPR